VQRLILGRLTLADIQELASVGGYSGVFELSNLTAVTLLSAAVLLSNPKLWIGADYQLTSTELDEIDALLGQVNIELMEEVSGVGDFVKITEASRDVDVNDLWMGSWGTEEFNLYKLIIRGLKSDRNSTLDHLILEINGSNVSSNYNSVGATFTGAANVNVSAMGTHPGIKISHVIDGLLSDSGCFGSIEITFFSPRNTGDKTAIMWDGTLGGETATELRRIIGSGWFELENAINSVKIFPELGNVFLVDPLDANDPDLLQMILYGVK